MLQQGPRDKHGTSCKTTCWAGEQGKGKWLHLTSISTLIHYHLYMSKRLPSVDSVEIACDAFVRLLSPKAQQTFPPSLPALSTVIQSDAFPSAFLLEWTLHHLHKLTHTNSGIHGVKTHMMANANRHTNTNLHKHQWHQCVVQELEHTCQSVQGQQILSYAAQLYLKQLRTLLKQKSSFQVKVFLKKQTYNFLAQQWGKSQWLRKLRRSEVYVSRV